MTMSGFKHTKASEAAARPAPPPDTRNDPLLEARRTLDRLTLPRSMAEIAAAMEPLSQMGQRDDIRRIDRVLAQPQLHEQVRDMAREIRRRIQEREYMLPDIYREEEEAVTERGLPQPRDASARWMAVRLGIAAMEGATLQEVEDKIARRQHDGQPFFAFTVEIDKPLPVIRRR